MTHGLHLPGPAGRGISRRTVLGAGIAALAVGAGATELGNLLAGSSPVAGEADPPPGEDLMNEHGVLQRVLLIYRECSQRLTAGQPLPVAAVAAGATIIHEFIEGFHEGLEEGYVFPRLRAVGKLVDTVDTLLVQHARGRQLTQFILANTASSQMSIATQESVTTAMEAFVRMYESHEAREDTVVFPAFRSILSEQESVELGSTFATLQGQQFGAAGFADVVARVADIEKSLGIYDLGQFTPAALDG